MPVAAVGALDRAAGGGAAGRKRRAGVAVGIVSGDGGRSSFFLLHPTTTSGIDLCSRLRRHLRRRQARPAHGLHPLGQRIALVPGWSTAICSRPRRPAAIRIDASAAAHRPLAFRRADATAQDQVIPRLVSRPVVRFGHQNLLDDETLRGSDLGGERRQSGIDSQKPMEQAGIAHVDLRRLHLPLAQIDLPGCNWRIIKASAGPMASGGGFTHSQGSAPPPSRPAVVMRSHHPEALQATANRTPHWGRSRSIARAMPGCRFPITRIRQRNPPSYRPRRHQFTQRTADRDPKTMRPRLSELCRSKSRAPKKNQEAGGLPAIGQHPQRVRSGRR